MTNLEQAAAQALQTVDALFASAEAARARFADLREQVLAAGERLEADWSGLRERAAHFLQQAASESQLLAAGQGEAHQALDTLTAAADQVLDEVPPEVQATQGGFAEMTARVDAIEGETQAAIDRSELAEASLHTRTEEVESELTAVLAEAEDLLRSTLTDDLHEFQEAAVQQTVQFTSYLTGECLPALTDKANELYAVLVQADEDVRNALDAAAELSEESAEAAVRECGQSYETGLDELDRLGESLTDLLGELHDFVEDEHGRVEDRKERWDEHIRDTQDSLREALERLKELEEDLAHFSVAR